MSRLIIALLATLVAAVPMANAQGMSLGPTNRTSTQIGGPSGTFYYPGFGYSSHPLAGYYGGGYGGYSGVGGYAPIYAAPLAVPGITGYFRIGGARVNYWQAPSGYYYPWGAGTAYQQQQPIYIVQQGVTQPQLPPLSSMLSDMENYLDDSKAKNKLTQSDYQRLFRRLQDVRGKFDHQRASNGGTLDPSDDELIRRDIDNLGGEISRAVKAPASAPVAAK